MTRDDEAPDRLHAVRDPRLIPAKRYHDPAFFELEKTKLWPRVWQMACRLEEIPEIGDYVEYTIFEKSVLVARTKSGIRAYHNACRHRGMKLAEGSGNCRSSGFICPFHGWRYDLEGKRTFVFAPKIFDQDTIDPVDVALKPCRVETWGGCAFINFDDDALPLRECLNPVADKLDARNAEKLRTEWWCASVVPTNWKVSVEAFLEQYHIMRTHPELHRLTPAALAALDLTGIYRQHEVTPREALHEVIDYLANLSEGMGGVVHSSEVAIMEKLRDMDIPDDPLGATTAFYTRARQDIMDAGSARGLPMHDMHRAAENYPSLSNELMFPNFFLLPMFGNMASYRIRPLTPETCLFEIWSLILVPEGEAHESPKAPTLLPHDSPAYPQIVQQDYYNMPMQQRGLASGQIEYQRIARLHEGAISNFERLIDGYLADLDSEQLVKAARLVNGGSFAPIADLGLST